MKNRQINFCKDNNFKNFNNKPKRILMILSTIGIGGGVQNTVMNIYRGIDREKIQFDFFVYAETSNSFEKEINKLGGNVFYPGRLRNVGVYKFYKYLYQVLKNNAYYAVHSHSGYTSGPSLLIARLLNINERIVHSHGTSINNKNLKYLMPILKSLIYFNASKLLSCSKQAGESLYGKKSFEILPNAIDTKRFFNIIDLQIQELKIKNNIKSDTVIIGHIGRFSVEKNHSFIIDVAKKLKKKNFKFQIILIGNGELKTEIIKKIKKNNLDNNFIFIENMPDIEKYYNIFDIFLLPSIHEGFGNVALEAQISKNKVIASKGVSQEVDLGLGLIEFIELENIESWTNEIINFNKSNTDVTKDNIVKALNRKCLDISTGIEKYYKIYGVK